MTSHYFISTGVVVAGAALYASTREDGVGSAMRSTGDTAVHAYERAAHSAQKHHVGEKLSAAGQATYKKATEIDDQYHISDNVKHATVVAAKEAKKINDKYDITGSASRAAASGARSVFKFIEGASKGSSGSSATNTNRVTGPN